MAWKQQTVNRARKLRRASTDEERILWSQLSNYENFPARFRKQYPIGPYFVDFYSRKAMVIIELDGSQHYEERYKYYDNQRTQFLEKRGLIVLRFWNEEIRINLRNVLEIIWDTCHSRMRK